ncbi:ZIP Zinc transporter [Venustampulla echinocandica]|uniref:ZIP Zinc transporter n=1 Tax=Venustampulla echinocandica TaxID=2656787 RepID=A0A370TRI1_9HELO|nr:ZIP Zinc transporter [Venustampulla echinocandica]RDL38142.1 ZIP Zinc transporter [Venustampulla echinocandica]
MDGDLRGWIMCIVSGIACVAGASIICVDFIIRYLPGKSKFRIQDSNAFLAASLSLSFGVMLFSALYSILPSSMKYLINGGFAPSAAAWILLAGFMGGFVGIQMVSRFLHRYIPSHVVDCDHHHGETSHHFTHNHTRPHSHGSHGADHHYLPLAKEPGLANGQPVESTPLLESDQDLNGRVLPQPDTAFVATDGPTSTGGDGETPSRRPSVIGVQRRLMSFVKDTKANCDSSGPCYGYSDPCGRECFKNLAAKMSYNPPRANSLRTAHASLTPEEAGRRSPSGRAGVITSPNLAARPMAEPIEESWETESQISGTEDPEAQHHHHVPENSFMNIGLQTSIAIALHKLPEGFITYATNHASPTLGWSVFIALLIHNITEGFALALPLFLALNSRVRAMLWASLLGGVSQPLGAGIAAAWLKIAGKSGNTPGEAIYGAMFAIIAGIMTSVAIQLFAESLSLNHNHKLCTAFAFIGMSIMGMSAALTA